METKKLRLRIGGYKLKEGIAKMIQLKNKRAFEKSYWYLTYKNNTK